MVPFIKDIAVALKGFAMGAANVIPGVSGGTIALLTGIFSRIVNCLNSVMEKETWKALLHGEWREFWKRIDGRFLLALLVGVLASVFSLAKLMEYVMNYHPVQTWGFFFGMIAASAVVMLVKVKGWKASDVLWGIFGIVLGVVICTLSPTDTPEDLWFIFVCGALAICTMILPGISGSFVLLILGKYEYIMGAVNNLNWPVLIVFGAGCVIGILAFSKCLHWLLGRYERQTMLVLVGFVIGSLVKVWPWNDLGAIVRSQLLAQGATVESAAAAVKALGTSAETLKPLVTDLHVGGAILWAFIGIATVAALELLSSGKEEQKNS